MSGEQGRGVSGEVVAALERQAWRHFQRWRLEEAEELARRALALAPERAWAQYLVGEVAARRGDWAGALEGFEAAIARGRRDGETLIRAGEAAWRCGQLERAGRHLQGAWQDEELPAPRRATVSRAMRRLRRLRRPAQPA